jgi:hypothetical protein
VTRRRFRNRSLLIGAASFFLVTALMLTSGAAQASGRALLEAHDGRLQALSSRSIASYRASLESASAALVRSIQDLQVAPIADVNMDQSDEDEAVLAFDQIRVADSDNPVNSAAIEGGLEAVNADLADGSAGLADDLASLEAQASVAQVLLARAALNPEEVVRDAVEDLNWVQTTALPGRAVPKAGAGGDRVVAGVLAAQQAFSALRPLGLEVDPSLTEVVARRMSAVDKAVAAAGSLKRQSVSSLSPPSRRSLSEDVGAAASGLAGLDSGLVRFGVSNSES